MTQKFAGVLRFSSHDAKGLAIPGQSWRPVSILIWCKVFGCRVSLGEFALNEAQLREFTQRNLYMNIGYDCNSVCDTTAWNGAPTAARCD